MAEKHDAQRHGAQAHAPRVVWKIARPCGGTARLGPRTSRANGRSSPVRGHDDHLMRVFRVRKKKKSLPTGEDVGPGWPNLFSGSILAASNDQERQERPKTGDHGPSVRAHQHAVERHSRAEDRPPRTSDDRPHDSARQQARPTRADRQWTRRPPSRQGAGKRVAPRSSVPSQCSADGAPGRHGKEVGPFWWIRCRAPGADQGEGGGRSGQHERERPRKPQQPRGPAPGCDASGPVQAGRARGWQRAV